MDESGGLTGCGGGGVGGSRGKVPVVDVPTLTDHSAMTQRRGSTSIHKVYTFAAKSMGKRRKDHAMSVGAIIIHVGRGRKDVAHISAFLQIQQLSPSAEGS